MFTSSYFLATALIFALSLCSSVLSESGGGRNFSFLRFASAVRPLDCTDGTVFTTLQTYNLLSSDTDYDLLLTNCEFHGGITFTGTSSAAAVKKVNVILSSPLIKNQLTVAGSLVLGEGSSFTLRDSTLSEMTDVTISPTLSVDPAISLLRNSITFTTASSFLTISSALTVANAPRATIRVIGNTISSTAATQSRAVQLKFPYSAAAISAVDTLIKDNVINCLATGCIDSAGPVNLTVTGNSFTSTSAVTSYYSLINMIPNYGTLDFDGTNTFPNRFTFTFSNTQVTPLIGRTRFDLRNTTAYRVNIMFNGVQVTGPMLADFSNAIILNIFSVDFGVHSDPETVLTLRGLTSVGAPVSVTAGTFPGAASVLDFSHIRLTGALLTVSSLIFDGLLRVEDCVSTTESSTGGILLYSLTSRGTSARISLQRNYVLLELGMTTGIYVNGWYRNPSPAVTSPTTTVAADGAATAAPTLIIAFNTVKFGASSAAMTAIAVSSAASSALSANFTIANNDLDLGAGAGLSMNVQAVDLIVVSNRIRALTTIASITAPSSRLTFDETNTFAVNGGAISVSMSAPTPRDGTVFRVANCRIAAITFNSLASPKLLSVSIVSVVLVSGAITVQLNTAVDPTVVLADITALGSSDVSSYQMNVAGSFYHNSSAYAGGLHLTIQATGAIFINDLTLGVIAGNNLWWQLTAPALVSIERNYAQSALSLTVSQNAADHVLTIRDNYVFTPVVKYNYQSSASTYSSLSLYWVRQGVGEAIFTMTNNSVLSAMVEDRLASSAVGFYWAASPTTSPLTPVRANISHNTFTGTTQGSALRILNVEVDLTLQHNVLLAGGVGHYMYAELTGSRIYFDQTNVLDKMVGGGIVEVVHTAARTPRSGSYFNVSGLRIQSVRYRIAETTALPASVVVSVSDVILSQEIAIALASVVSQTLVVNNIQTLPTATTKSSYQLKNADFEHGHCAYYYGLDLDLDAPLSVVLHHLTIPALSTWTINAKVFLNIRDNVLGGLKITCAQSMDQHMLLFDHNVIKKLEPSAIGVQIAWTRSATGGESYLSIMNNSFTYASGISPTLSTAAAIQVDSNAVTANKATANVILNNIRAIGTAPALVFTVNEMDLSIQNNWINSSIAYLRATLGKSRLTFDESNVCADGGRGNIEVRSTNPRDGNVFNISNLVLNYLHYELLPITVSPLNERVHIVNMDIFTTVTVGLAEAQSPTLVLQQIACAGLVGASSIRVKSIDFVHAYNRYNASLNLFVSSPMAITLDHLFIGLASTWEVTAPQSLVITNSRLPQIALTVTQSMDDRSIIYANNTVTFDHARTTSNSVTPTYRALDLLWRRVGGKTGLLLIENNNMSAPTTSPTSSDCFLYLRSSGSATTTAFDASVIVQGNRVNVGPSGNGMNIDADNIDFTARRNSIVSAQYVIYAILRQSRVDVTMVEPNAAIAPVSASVAGYVHMSLSSAPRDSNVFNISNQRLRGIVYTAVSTGSSRNDVMSITDVALTDLINVDMGGAIDPFFHVENVDAGTSRSQLKVKSVDVWLNHSSFDGGLDLGITSPNAITVHDISMGPATTTPVPTWTLSTGSYFNMTRCTASVVVISLTITNNTLPPMIYFDNNTFMSPTTYIGAPQYSAPALYLDLKRPSVPTALSRPLGGQLVFTNNNMNFTAGSSTANSRGIHLNAVATTSASAYIAPVDLLFLNNSITNPHGYCLDLTVHHANITVKNNSLLALNAVTGRVLSATLTNANIALDMSNTMAASGGGFYISHANNPQNFNYINISNMNISTFYYVQSNPSSASQSVVSYGDVISLRNIRLANELNLQMGHSILPLVVLDDIVANTKSTIQMRTDVFVHNFGRYRDGLDFAIESQNITIHNISVGTATVLSTWTFTAGRYLNISNNVLPCLQLNPSMLGSVANPTIIFENNIVLGTNVYTFGVNFNWNRAGLGEDGMFLVRNNIINFTHLSSTTGFQLSAVGDATIAPVAVVFENNNITVTSGYAIRIAVDKANISFVDNAISVPYFTSYALYANPMKDCSVYFDNSNTLVANGGGIYIAHTERPRNGNYFNLTHRSVGFVRYEHPATAISRNDVVIVHDVVCGSDFSILLGLSDNPTVELYNLRANGASASTVQFLNIVDFLIYDSYFKNGLNFFVNARRNFEVYGLEMGTAGIRFVVSAPNYFHVHHNVFPSVRFEVTQTAANTNPLFHVDNNSFVSINDEFRYASYTTINYAVVFWYVRGASFATPQFVVENNTASFITGNNGASRAFFFGTSGGTADNVLRLVVSNNALLAGIGFGMELQLEQADVTVTNNRIFGGSYTVYAVMVASRITYDDLNAILPVGAGHISMVHSSSPRNGSYVKVTNRQLAGFTYSAGSSGDYSHNTTLIVSDLVLLQALSITLYYATSPTFVVERITATAASTISIGGIRSFDLTNSSFGAGVALSVAASDLVRVRGIRAGSSANKWSFVTPTLVEVLDSTLGETLVVATMSGQSPRVTIRNNIITTTNTAVYRVNYVDSYYGLYVIWTRTGATGRPLMEVRNNTITHLTTSLASYSRSLHIGTSKNAADPMTDIVVDGNIMKALSAHVLTCEVFSSNLVVTNNVLQNVATSSAINSMLAALSGSRIYFDESNTLSHGGGAVSVTHNDLQPLPSNVVIVSKNIANVRYVSYYPVSCDRIAVYGATLLEAPFISISGAATNSEITLWGVTSTSASSRAAVSVATLLNSLVRVEECKMAGIDFNVAAVTPNTTVHVRGNAFTAHAVMTAGGAYGTVDIRDNNFTSNTNGYAALTLGWTLNGVARAMFIRNRIVLTGTGSSSLAMTCTPGSWAQGLDFPNSSLIIDGNLLTGSGTNGICACAGIAIVRNNVFSPTSTVQLRIPEDSALFIDNSNAFKDTTVSITTGVRSHFDWDLRYSRLNGLTSTQANYKTFRLRMDTVQIIGAVALALNGAGPLATSIAFIGCVVSGSTSIVTRLPNLALVHLRGSQFAGGLAVTTYSAAYSALTDPQSSLLVEGCNIGTSLVLRLSTVMATPWAFVDNTVTTAGSTTSAIEVYADVVVGQVRNNTFLKATATSRLEFQVAGNLALTGGVVVAHNTFSLPVHYSGNLGTYTYGRLLFAANAFNEPLTMAFSGTVNLWLIGNRFTATAAPPFALTSANRAANAVAGCNTNASGAMYAAADFSSGLMAEASCPDTTFDFCLGSGGSATGLMANFGGLTAGLCPQMTIPPSSTAMMDGQWRDWSWGLVGVTTVADPFTAFAAYYSTPVVVYWISMGMCPHDPLYVWRNVTWPPQELVTTTTTAPPTLRPAETTGGTLSQITVSYDGDRTTTVTTTTAAAGVTPAATTAVGPTPATPSSGSTAASTTAAVTGGSGATAATTAVSPTTTLAGGSTPSPTAGSGPTSSAVTSLPTDGGFFTTPQGCLCPSSFTTMPTFYTNPTYGSAVAPQPTAPATHPTFPIPTDASGNSIPATHPTFVVPTDTNGNTVPATYPSPAVPTDASGNTIPATYPQQTVPSDASGNTIPATYPSQTIPTDASGNTVPATYPTAPIPTDSSGNTVPATYPPATAPTDTNGNTIPATYPSAAIPTDTNGNTVPATYPPQTVPTDNSGNTVTATYPTAPIPTDASGQTITATYPPQTAPTDTNGDTIPATYPPFVIPTDANGNHVPATYPTFVVPTDASGNTIPPTYATQQPTVPTDTNGNTIPATYPPSAPPIPTDADGDTVAATWPSEFAVLTDADGSTIAATYPSSPAIPTGADGSTVAATYPADASVPTDADGSTIAATHPTAFVVPTDTNGASVPATYPPTFVIPTDAGGGTLPATYAPTMAPIPTDTNGNTVPATYPSPATVIPTDASGNTIPATYPQQTVPTDANGNTIPATYPSQTVPTDANGNTVPATYPTAPLPTDASGNTVPATYPPATAPTDTNGNTIPATYPSAAIPTDADGNTVPATYPPQTVPTDANGNTIPATYPTAPIPTGTNGQTVPATYPPQTAPTDTNGDTIPATYPPFVIPTDASGNTLPATYPTFVIPTDTNGNTIPATYPPATAPTDANGNTIPATYPSVIIPTDADGNTIPATYPTFPIPTDADGNAIPATFPPTTAVCPPALPSTITHRDALLRVGDDGSARINWDSLVVNKTAPPIAFAVPFSSPFATGLAVEWSLVTMDLNTGTNASEPIDAVGSSCSATAFGFGDAYAFECNVSLHENWNAIQPPRSNVRYAIVATIRFAAANIDFATMNVHSTNTTVILSIAVDIIPIINNAAAVDSLNLLLAQTTDDTGMLFIGDPFSVEVQLATAILLGPCATAGDRTMARVARYVDLSPFIDLGAATVALVHGLIATVLLIAHGAATYGYAKRQFSQQYPAGTHDIDDGDSPPSLLTAFFVACSKLAFPSASMFVAMLLYPGTAVSVVDLFRDGTASTDGLRYAALVLGLCHMIWVPCLLLAVIVAPRLLTVLTDNHERHMPPQISGQYRVAAPPSAPSDNSGPIALFRPVGVWEPTTQRAMLSLRPFVQGTSNLLRGTLLAPAAIILVIILCAVLFTDRDTQNSAADGCGPRTFVSAAIAALAASAVIAIRPFVTLFANLTTFAALVGLALLLLIHGVAMVKDLVGADGGGALWTVKVLALVIIFAATLLRTMHFIALLLFSKPPKPTKPFSISADSSPSAALYDELYSSSGGDDSFTGNSSELLSNNGGAEKKQNQLDHFQQHQKEEVYAQRSPFKNGDAFGGDDDHDEGLYSIEEERRSNTNNDDEEEEGIVAINFGASAADFNDVDASAGDRAHAAGAYHDEDDGSPMTDRIVRDHHSDTDEEVVANASLSRGISATVMAGCGLGTAARLNAQQVIGGGGGGGSSMATPTRGDAADAHVASPYSSEEEEEGVIDSQQQAVAFAAGRAAVTFDNDVPPMMPSVRNNNSEYSSSSASSEELDVADILPPPAAIPLIDDAPPVVNIHGDDDVTATAENEIVAVPVVPRPRREFAVGHLFDDEESDDEVSAGGQRSGGEEMMQQQQHHTKAGGHANANDFANGFIDDLTFGDDDDDDSAEETNGEEDRLEAARIPNRRRQVIGNGDGASEGRGSTGSATASDDEDAMSEGSDDHQRLEQLHDEVNFY